MLVSLRSKETESVVAALSQPVRKLPVTLKRSLTWDRRLEMASQRVSYRCAVPLLRSTQPLATRGERRCRARRGPRKHQSAHFIAVAAVRDVEHRRARRNAIGAPSINCSKERKVSSRIVPLSSKMLNHQQSAKRGRNYSEQRHLIHHEGAGLPKNDHTLSDVLQFTNVGKLLVARYLRQRCSAVVSQYLLVAARLRKPRPSGATAPC